MSKYDALWQFVENEFNQKDIKKLELSFKQIEECLGFKIDHSFLRYKKEVQDLGYCVKISLKEQKILFVKQENN